MKHLVEAHDAMSPSQQEHIEVNTADHSVCVTIQDGPIQEAGENGIQATDMLIYVKNLFESLNAAYPCRENALSITKIDEAIHWQFARTMDRRKRNVEGQSKA